MSDPIDLDALEAHAHGADRVEHWDAMRALLSPAVVLRLIEQARRLQKAREAWREFSASWPGVSAALEGP